MRTTFSYTTTMGSMATESLNLNQDAQMALAISHLQANPNQSIRQIARTFGLPQSTLNHRLNGRQSSQEFSQTQQKLLVIKEDSLIKWINIMAS